MPWIKLKIALFGIFEFFFLYLIGFRQTQNLSNDFFFATNNKKLQAVSWFQIVVEIKKINVALLI